jgi:hypothetical protein
MSFSSATVSLALILRAVPCLLAAQPDPQRATESNTQRIRDECAVYRSVLERDKRITRANARQVQELRQCRESAGAVLPAIWLDVRPDSLELSAVITASSTIRDARITDALERTLGDSSRPSLVRQVAATALAGNVIPGLIGSIDPGEIPGERWTIGVSFFAHLRPEDGPVVPDAGLKARLITRLEGMAGTSARRNSEQRLYFLLLAYLRLPPR